MKILAIETSGIACSAALKVNDDIVELMEVAPKKHASLILPMINSLLQQASLSLQDVDAIAVANGPGSFTGIRIACSVVQGLAFAAKLPVIPVSSLQTLAQSAYRLHQCKSVIAAFDARMQEVYWGAFELSAQGIMHACGQEFVASPSAVTCSDNRTWIGAGEGFVAYPELSKLVNSVYPDIVPHAKDLAHLASHSKIFLDAEQIQPVYLRDRVV